MKNKGSLTEILFPTGIKCVLCDDELDGTTGGILCERCRLPFNTQFCKKCGRAMKVGGGYCFECQNFPSFADRAVAPFVYKDGARKMVRSLKFGNARFLSSYMAEFMTDAFLQIGLTADFVTFAPMAARKQRGRGYNQAELLASEVAKRLNLSCVSLLDRVRVSKHTARLKRYQRKLSVKNSIKAIAGINLNGKTVLLVDDVYTTGTTAEECAKILKESGAGKVYVLTFATSKIFNREMGFRDELEDDQEMEFDQELESEIDDFD